MYDIADDSLFGRDGRHKPLPKIAKGDASFCIWKNHKRISLKARNQIIDRYAELFDAPAWVGGDILFNSNCHRFIILTWDYGRIECDLFYENILFLVEEPHRDAIIRILERNGNTCEIIGDKGFINIKIIKDGI